MGWEENLLAYARGMGNPDSDQYRKRNERKQSVRLSFHCHERMLDWAQDAAEERGMSRISYARRAVAGYIAHDLNLPYSEVVAGSPKPMDTQAMLTGRRADNHNDGKDTGLGFGDWVIDSLSPVPLPWYLEP